MVLLNENVLDDIQENKMGAEDPENDSLMLESAIIQSHSADEIKSILEGTELDTAIYNEKLLSERTIVRLDKYAKKNRFKMQAVLAIAKEKNDKLFKKLITVWKMRKMLEHKLEQKYGTLAERRAREMMKKAKSSQSPSVRKAAAFVGKKTM
jgi:hypothetical protein